MRWAISLWNRKTGCESSAWDLHFRFVIWDFPGSRVSAFRVSNRLGREWERNSSLPACRTAVPPHVSLNTKCLSSVCIASLVACEYAGARWGGRKEGETGRRESERLTPPGKEDLFVRRLCISFVFISMLCRAFKFLCEHSLHSPSLPSYCTLPSTTFSPLSL